MWIIAIIGTFILWKVSKFFAEHPPKIELEASLPVFEWETPQETAEEKYHRLLAKADALPLNDKERRFVQGQLRKQYIADSMR